MANPTISLIVAMAEDRAIGINKGMLWHLPNDFKHFKKTTTGHPVIMGRKTFQSLGGALPNRTNIVITRNSGYHPADATVVTTLDEALDLARKHESEEVFIAGGGEIYKQSLDIADKLYLTLVHGSFPNADTFFPKIDWNQWEEVERKEHEADPKHKYAFSIIFLERKK